MTVKEFISSLEKMNFSLSVEDGKLNLRGDKQKLSREQIEAIKLNKDVIGYIKAHKEELIEYISGLSEPSAVKKSKNISSIYRLSGLQEGMLFHGLYDEDARAYEVHFNCDLIGLIPQTFKDTWSYILKHHSILRSAFYYDSFNAPVQCVYNEVALPVTELDFRNLSATGQAAAVEKYEAEDRNKGFDFKKPPLTRFTLIRLGEDRYRMIWTTHHILFDGWSLPILMEEFLTTYELLASGKKVKDAEEDRYEDYIRYIERVDKDEEEQYWRSYLKGIEHNTLLPFIGTTTERTTGTGEYRSISSFLDEVTTGKIQNYAQKHRVTINTLMQGVWSYLLHEYTGKANIAYGVIVSGRPDDLQNVEKRVGMYINTLPLHSQINAEQEIAAWLQQIQEEQVSSRKYQYTPLNNIQRWNGITGVLFDTLLVFENYPASKLITSKKWCLGVENIQSHEQTNYPLSVIINSSEEIKIGFSYNTQLLDEVYVKEISKHFENVLLQMVENDSSTISTLRLLTSLEEQQLSEGFKSPEAAYDEGATLVSLFEKQAAKSPDAVAVLDGDTKLNYFALDEESNRLASYLQSKGVGSGSLVPLCMERGTGLIVGILGILKSGAAYVPIDPAYPEDRINYMLEDSNARIVVSSKASRPQLTSRADLTIIETDGADLPAIARTPSGKPESGLSPEDLAYVIYTSGSTGTPKGVEITHKNAASFIAWCQDEFLSSRFETVFFSTSICFDLSIYEIFYPLSIGKNFRILENGLAISQFLSTDKHILLNTVPSVVTGLLAEGADLSLVTVLNMAGEPVPAQLVQNLDTARMEVRNLYGPTEDTTYSTVYRLKKDKPVLIGKPIAGTQIYIVNFRHQLCPAGIAGELCIGGNGLARGYLNRPALTAEKFVTNPFSKEAGARMYKTGDLARRLPDGNIEYLGRIDDQVKIRGFRIELGEIENVLEQHGRVRQSVVIAKEDSSGNKRLVAYVVPEGDFNKEEIQGWLQSKLPEYMVPGVWVELENLPLTPNGKVDKKALPDPEINSLVSQEYVAPRTETEKKLAGIWQELLAIEQIGIHDNFFELGGHSLLAMRVISAIRRELKADVAIKDLFVRPTISQLGSYLAEQVKGSDMPSIKALSRPEQIPLSYSQERLWFIDQLEGSTQYHMPAVLRIKGALNAEALKNTLNDIVNRHEVLRSVIRQKDGQAYQFPKELNQWSLEIVDGSAYTDRNTLKNFIQELIQKPFDLSEDFMLRASLIAIGNQNFVLVVTLHHIASDGWSRSILVKEIVELYASRKKGSVPDLPPLTIQYADYAIWQRSYLKAGVLDQKIDYWKKQLDGTATLNLPTDFTRPAVQSTRGASAGFKVSKDVAKKINELNQTQGTTLYMTLLSVFKVLLYRYSGQQDICVGTGIAGRQHYETEGLIGFFVNTLAMRSQVYGDNAFSEFLQTVKATTLEAFTHQEVPFEKVVDAVVHERDLSRNPLVQVTFIVQNTPDIPQLALDDVELGVEDFDHITSRFDISFGVKPTANGIEFLVEYCADLFYPETIQRMIGHYQQLLASVLENPDQKIDSLILIDQEEKQQLNAFSNADLNTQPSGETLVSLFEKQVNKTPYATALVFGEQTLSYKILNERANQLARFIITLGVQKETLVPICIGRSPEMIIGILGILKAGGAYVPIDPSYPQDRIDFMLADTKANLVVSSSGASERLLKQSAIRIVLLDGTDKKLIAAQDSTNLPETIGDNQLAYVIYTSGSTGKPKGVLVEHRSVTNYITGQAEYLGIDDTDRIVQFSNYCFDASVEQIFLALTNGASLILFDEGLQLNPERFSMFLNEAGVTHLHSTPFFLENLVPEKCGQLRRIIAGGDLCRRELVNKWKGKGDFYNKYGPTETAISVVEYKVEIDSLKSATSVPIGKPLANVAVYVLDKNQAVCPVGIPGEIYVGGIQVSRGYLNQPELTADSFIEETSSSLTDARLYRTGDLGRWLADGDLEYLGRIDDQVKIHGYRIETGEIESVLNELASVDNSCVVVKEDKDTRNNRLVVYYLPNRSAVKLKEAQLYDDQVSSWKEIHENEYITAKGISEDPEFDILGWNDSFTRNAIPAEHMREWLEDIINVIFSGRVERVLEIGSGSGLIYYQLAGKVKKYIGTDFSKASINLIRNRINLRLRDYGPTELQVSAAHEVRVNDTESIDTIVLNSIIQYFPGEEYLSKVIENSISILKSQGRIVIGDVRDLRTLKLFKARLKLEKLPDFLSLAEFNWSLNQDMLNEEELCFAPEYFYALQGRYPEITHVEIVWKHGSYVNELSAYRYSVVIYVGLEKDVYQPEWQSWHPEEGSANIVAQLENGASLIAVKDVPNPRLQRESELLNTLNQGAVKNVGQLLAVINQVAELDEVNKMISAAEAKGYSYKLLLDEDPLKLNILIEQSPADRFIGNIYSEVDTGASGTEFTNVPLFNDICSQLQKDIRNLMLETLPEYMIPSKFIAIQKMPLNSNGKIDRKFLSVIENTSSGSRADYQAPGTDLEKSISDIWKNLLNIEQVGINDNFFELGGHSLLAVRVISMIRKELNIELVVRDLFSYPTISELAAYLETLGSGSLLPSITVAQRPEHIPLSFSQERLWFIDQLEGSVQYQIPAVLRLKGILDRNALSNALLTVINRHEALRTIIKDREGQGYQYVQEANDWTLQIISRSEIKAGNRDLQKFIQDLILTPFDLAKDYMLRAQLIELDEQDHILVATMHHIASDGWSTSILVKEVVELYAAYTDQREPQLSALAIQYADYAIWQRDYLQGELFDKKLAYWKEKLKDVSVLQLPADYERPVEITIRGASADIRIEPSLVRELESLSQKQGTTLYMTLLSAFKVLMHKYSGQSDICIGTPVAGRTRHEVENLIGFFVNTLALRSEVRSEASFSSLLQDVRTMTLDAFDNQDVPFEKVVEAVAAKREAGRNTLFQTVFVLQNTPDVPELRLGNLNLSLEGFEHTTTQFDFTIKLAETENGLNIKWEFKADLYAMSTIEQMLRHYKNLLESIVSSPEQQIGLLSMLNKAEEEQILLFNATHASYPEDKSIADLFEEQVAEKPDALAVLFERRQLTYKQLDDRSNQLANYIKAKNIQPGTNIGLLSFRGEPMIIGMLGILKAGCVYVPLNTEYPKERIKYIIEDAGIVHVVYTDKALVELYELEDVEIFNINESVLSSTLCSRPKSYSDSPVYIMYTSGTTGRPKGIVVSQKNIIKLVFDPGEISVSSEDRMLQWSNYSFDGSTYEIYSSLLKGASLQLIKENQASDIYELSKIIEEQKITICFITTALFNTFVDVNPQAISRLRKILFGGEMVSAYHVRKAIAVLGSGKIVHVYGPTETTVYATSYLVQSVNKNVSIPIGKPLSNTTIFILNGFGKMVPIGVPGEIYIGGRGVSTGYVNNLGLTAEKFIKDPFSNHEGARLYKTGDIGRWLPDGNIEYLSRIDNQVKVRGYRIELGEIESVLMQSKLIKQTVVLAREDQQGTKKLIGYVIPEEDFDQQTIQKYLQLKLPEYMVPALWVVLDSFPLTSNGKTDKNALPDPDVSALLRDEYVAPRNETEAALVAIWEELLELDRVGIYDNFFELGGHSLLAIRLISAIRKQLGTEVAISKIFDSPTVALLAAEIELKSELVILPTLQIAARPPRIPLSFSQQRLWFIDQLDGSVQYHIAAVMRLKGNLNIQALTYAISNIINRHEVLRTVFPNQDGEAWQVIKDKAEWELVKRDGTIFQHDLQGLKSLIQQIINAPFDLSKDNMLRSDLILLNEEDNVLIVTLHHIASDGWSRTILVKEVAEFYAAFDQGREPVLTPLPVQYADFSIWQRNYLQGEILDKKLGYWINKLKGVEHIQMPADFTRPAIQTNRGASAVFSFDKRISDALQQLSRQNESTLFMTLLTALKILLHRYTGSEDICIGTAIAGRQQQETEGLIGFFINTLALRTAVHPDDTFTGLLKQIKQTTLEAYEHQEVPFEKVVEALTTKRDRSRSPLFQVMFVLQNTPEVPDLELGELQFIREDYEHNTAQFDLSFSVIESSEGLTGSVVYNSDIYADKTINRLLVHFTQVVESVIKEPAKKVSQLQVLSAEEKHKLIFDINASSAEYPKEKSLVSLFQEQAARSPEAVALVFEDAELNYGELNRHSNQLAHYLIAHGVKPGTLVPLCIERGMDMIIAILGILKAGGVYVPIDPEYPAERISYMLEDTQAGLAVSSQTSRGKLGETGAMKVIKRDGADRDAISRAPAENPETEIGANHLAYVIYTSGSTGRPKGVLIEHGSVINLIYAQSAYFNINKDERILQFSNYCFDASVEQIFLALLNGASLVMFKESLQYDTTQFEELLKEQRITHLHATPFFLENIRPGGYPDLKRVIAGGDVCRKELTARWKNEVDFYNEYGPTETTVTAIEYQDNTENEAQSIVPIGKPLANVKVYILDQNQEPSPYGVPGELYIGGVQVARGYLNRPELTTEKFVVDRFSTETGARLYRTGDQVRWLPDGNIEFLGRIDEQVKVRGYRIEPGEIESVLQQQATIKQAVVLAREDGTGSKRLVGYVVADEGFDKQETESSLRGKLPDYMVPSLWVVLDELPLTPNGKIDKKALPEPDMSGQTGEAYTAPQNETQQKLARIWEELLGLEQVSIHNGFFELGGHSLLAMRAVSSIRKELNAELTIRDLFIRPTISELSRYLEETKREGRLPAIAPAIRPDHIPLSFSQERLWFIDQLEGSVPYNLPTVLRIKGSLNEEALEYAIREIINRHEVLRTVYLEADGKPYQFINTAENWKLSFIDGAAYRKDPEGLKTFIAELIMAPFNLSSDYMLRTSLIKIDVENYIAVVVMHHIASDAWSTPIIIREVVELYSAFDEKRSPDLPQLAVQYADFAIWQRQFTGEEILDEKINYWRNKLAGVSAIQLQTDFSRPSLRTINGASVQLIVAKELSDRLLELSRQEGATLYMTLLATFNVLLNRYSGDQDICVGTSIANRPQKELEDLIGFFVNTLALRNQVDGALTFRNLLAQVKLTMLEAYEHQDVPFERVVEEVVKERDPARSPLFQVMLILLNMPETSKVGFSNVELSNEVFEIKISKVDFTFHVSLTSKGLHIFIVYNTDLFREDTMLRMAGHYTELLKSVVQNPDEIIDSLQMLTEEEEQQLLNEFNRMQQ